MPMWLNWQSSWFVISRLSVQVRSSAFGPVAQLVRAPPCHGGGHGFESRLGRFFGNEELNSSIWDHSSAGRASALQAEGHRFESYWSHWCRRGGTGRRPGLKILWVAIPVPVRFRSPAFKITQSVILFAVIQFYIYTVCARSSAG